MITINCQSCVSKQFCLPFGLNRYEVTRLENIIVRNPLLQKGEALFECGDALTALYIIRSGVIKSYKITPHGKKQITAFYSTGDVLGLEAIAERRHPTSAEALDTSMICRIPFQPLERLSEQIPLLRRQLLCLMSRHIRDDQENLSIIRRSAQVRLTAFIYKMVCNRGRLGLSSPTSLYLPMSRTDIGNYLGLSLETVIRLFRTLQQNGTITINGRCITVHDSDKLARFVQGTR